MKANYEAVRSLEQQESGEMRSQRCAACGARVVGSRDEQLARHQSACGGPANGAARRAAHS